MHVGVLDRGIALAVGEIPGGDGEAGVLPAVDFAGGEAGAGVEVWGVGEGEGGEDEGGEDDAAH